MVKVRTELAAAAGDFCTAPSADILLVAAEKDEPVPEGELKEAAIQPQSESDHSLTSRLQSSTTSTI